MKKNPTTFQNFDEPIIHVLKYTTFQTLPDMIRPVYIGRGSALGNPHYITREVSRNESIRRFKKTLWDEMNIETGPASKRACAYILPTSVNEAGKWFKQDHSMLIEIHDLASKALRQGFLDLGCFCAPLACHGNVIKRAIHWLIKTKQVTLTQSIEDSRGITDRETPQELEGDAKIFDDSEHGESFDGMAKHSSEMKHLDRMISEDCYYRGGKVSHQRLHFTDGLNLYQRPEYLSKRLQINLETATVFVNHFRTLSLRTSDIEKIIKGIIKKKTTVKAFLVLATWASALDEIDRPKRHELLNFLHEDILESDERDLNQIQEDLDDLDGDLIGHDPFTFIPINEMLHSPKPFSKDYEQITSHLKSRNYQTVKATTKDAFKRLTGIELTMYLRQYETAKTRAIKWEADSNPGFDKLHKRTKTFTLETQNKAGSFLARLADGKETVTNYTPNTKTTAILKDTFFLRKKELEA